MPLPDPGSVAVSPTFASPDLQLRAYLDLDADECRDLRQRVGQPVVHSRFRGPAPPDTGFSSYSGRIGIHLSENEEQKWIHYEFTLSDATSPSNESDPNWESVLAALSEVLGKHEAEARFTAHVPSDIVTFKPIELQGLAGFSHVKGFRLAKTDPDDASSDLYSVIVDHWSDHAVLDARVSVELTLSKGLFEQPWSLLTNVMAMIASDGPSNEEESK